MTTRKWLAECHAWLDDPVCAVVWKKGNVRNSSEWVDSVGGEWLSKELDDAIGEKT